MFNRKPVPVTAQPQAKAEKPLRVVIYARENESGSHLIERHVAAVQAYCTAHGYEVVSCFTGDGESNCGRGPWRPAFEQALAAVESGEADALAVAELNQLAKTVPYLLDLLERFEQGPTLISATEGIEYPHRAGILTRLLLQAVIKTASKSTPGLAGVAVPTAVVRPKAVAPPKAKPRTAAEIAEIAAQNLEANTRRCYEQTQAAFAAADKARREGPKFDEQIAETRRLRIERDQTADKERQQLQKEVRDQIAEQRRG